VPALLAAWLCTAGAAAATTGFVIVVCVLANKFYEFKSFYLKKNIVENINKKMVEKKNELFSVYENFINS
jgi:hypothetical protein